MNRKLRMGMIGRRKRHLFFYAQKRKKEMKTGSEVIVSPQMS